MNKRIARVAVPVTACLLLMILPGACAKAPVTTTAPPVTKTVPVTETKPVTQTLPVTQLVTATATATSTVTVTNERTFTVAITATGPTVTATVTSAPVTTTKTATLTQFWPPVTSFYGSVNYYYLPTMAIGQVAYCILKYEGAAVSYIVLDPSNTNILSGNITSPTPSGSGSFSFKAAIAGVYRIECIPAQDLPSSLITLFFTVN